MHVDTFRTSTIYMIRSMRWRMCLFLLKYSDAFFFDRLSITTNAARMVDVYSSFPLLRFTIWKVSGSLQVYVFKRQGHPTSSIWWKVHPKHKVPYNVVWLCSAIYVLLGIPILRVNVTLTAITSICMIRWVGGHAVPIFVRMVMEEKHFNPGHFTWAMQVEQSGW